MHVNHINRFTLFVPFNLQDQMLINIAIEQMLADSEPELGCAFQIMGVIRILLDPENMITGKTDFLNFFYKHSIQTLIGELH